MRPEAEIAPVVEDMERIFAPLAGRPAGALPQIVSTPPARGRSVLLAPALAVLAAGGALAIAYDLGTVPPVKASARTAERATATRAPATEPAPTPTENLRVASLTVYPTPAATPSPATAVVEAPTEPVRPSVTTRRPTSRGVTASTNRAPAGSPDAPRCGPGSPEDHCIYRDVMSADARLRRAYERAADAGVSPSWLASINRRWERARDVSRNNPDRAIDRFDRLADALDDERGAMM